MSITPDCVASRGWSGPSVTSERAGRSSTEVCGYTSFAESYTAVGWFCLPSPICPGATILHLPPSRPCPRCRPGATAAPPRINGTVGAPDALPPAQFAYGTGTGQAGTGAPARPGGDRRAGRRCQPGLRRHRHPGGCRADPRHDPAGQLHDRSGGSWHRDLAHRASFEPLRVGPDAGVAAGAERRRVGYERLIVPGGPAGAGRGDRGQRRRHGGRGGRAAALCLRRGSGKNPAALCRRRRQDRSRSGAERAAGVGRAAGEGRADRADPGIRRGRARPPVLRAAARRRGRRQGFRLRDAGCVPRPERRRAGGSGAGDPAVAHQRRSGCVFAATLHRPGAAGLCADRPRPPADVAVVACLLPAEQPLRGRCLCAAAGLHPGQRDRPAEQSEPFAKRPIGRGQSGSGIGSGGAGGLGGGSAGGLGRSSLSGGIGRRSAAVASASPAAALASPAGLQQGGVLGHRRTAAAATAGPGCRCQSAAGRPGAGRRRTNAPIRCG